MSHARIKEVCEDQPVYYLVTNRIAGGRFLFKNQEKQKLKELLFDGVDRLSYQVVGPRRSGNYIVSGCR